MRDNNQNHHIYMASLTEKIGYALGDAASGGITWKIMSIAFPFYFTNVFGFLGWNQGTGKDPSAGQPVTFTSVPDFEDYGTGCFMLGAIEYYRLLSE